MSSKNNNKLNIPEARAAMDKFKMEAANEVGVNLKEGYNGHLTSREAGSVGGQMVTSPTRRTCKRIPCTNPRRERLSRPLRGFCFKYFIAGRLP